MIFVSCYNIDAALKSFTWNTIFRFYNIHEDFYNDVEIITVV